MQKVVAGRLLEDLSKTKTKKEKEKGAFGSCTRDCFRPCHCMAFAMGKGDLAAFASEVPEI
jgi:hypothetical protein